MPRELPGFYFDSDRNRYFPISNNRSPYAVPIPYTSSQKFDAGPSIAGRSTAQPSTTNTASAPLGPGRRTSIHVDRPERRRNTSLRRDLQRSSGFADRLECLHHIQTASLTSMVLKGDSKAPFDFQGTYITAIDISNEKIFVGDKSGMLYVTSIDSPDDSWVAHHHLGSQISSVHIHNGTMYAASLGPKPQIFISTDEYMSSLSMHSFHDMWTVHWLNPEGPADEHDSATSMPSAVIGMKQRAVYMPSLETHRGSYIMSTNSDVFSVYKHRSQIFTGARNGSVKLFDIRVPPTSHITLFNPCVRSSRNTGKWDSLSSNPNTHRGKPYSVTTHLSSTNTQASDGHSGSVTNLRMIDEWGLLLAAMDGTLAVYDLRFCSLTSGAGKLPPSSKPPPVMRLSGHVNSCSQGLGFYVDHRSNFVFAAGEDKKVRAWSLRSGEAILPMDVQFPMVIGDSSRIWPGIRERGKSTLLRTTFTNPVNAIALSSCSTSFSPNNSQIPLDDSEDRRERGFRELWVASGRDLFCFEGPLSIV